MQLTETHIEQLKKAAEKIGDYGRVTLIVNDKTWDVIVESRERFQDGSKAAPSKGNAAWRC